MAEPIDKRAALLAWIDEQLKVCEGATPGPWFAWLSKHAGWTVQIANGWLLSASAKMDKEGKDAAFIALSRTVLPLLLAGVREEVARHECEEEWRDDEDKAKGCKLRCAACDRDWSVGECADILRWSAALLKETR